MTPNGIEATWGTVMLTRRLLLISLATLLVGVAIWLAVRLYRAGPDPAADGKAEVEALIDALCASVKVDLVAAGRGQPPKEFLAGAAKDDPDSWYNLGTFHLHAGDYEAGVRSLDFAIRLDAKNPAAWNNKGLCLRRLFRHEEALDCFRQARDLDPMSPTPGANIAAAEEELALVRSAAGKLFPRLEELPAEDRPRALRGLAFLHKGMQLTNEDPPAALFCFSRAAERLELLAPCNARAAMAHLLFARVGMSSGGVPPDKITDALTRARRLVAGSPGAAPVECEIAYSLGRGFLRAGRYEQAAEEFRRVADSPAVGQESGRESACHAFRGSALSSLHSYELAEVEFRAARRLAAVEPPGPLLESSREAAFAQLLMVQGRIDEAEEAIRSSQRLAEKVADAALIENPVPPGLSEGLLGMCLHEKGDHEGACVQLRACLGKMNRVDAGPRQRGVPLLYLGKALTRLGRSAEALEVCRSAVREQPAWDRHEALAVVLEARGDTDSLRDALAERVRAVEDIEKREREVLATEYRVSWFEDRAAVYENLAVLLLRMRREGVKARDPTQEADAEEQAMHYADRGRARALGGLMASGPEAGAGGGVRAERAKLAGEIQELLKRRGVVGGDASLARAIEQKEARHRELEADLRRSPAGVLAQTAESLRPRDFQKTLLPGEACLEYVAADPELIVFAMTADALRTYRVPIRREAGAVPGGRGREAAVLMQAFREAPERLGLEALVWLHRQRTDHWRSPPLTEAEHVAVSRTLARLLLPPELRRDLARDRVRHLAIVPARSLALVSFAGLVLGGSPDTFAGSRFLVEDFTVSYGQSLAVLGAVGRRARERPPGDGDGPDLLAFADPVHDDGDPRAARPPGTLPPVAEDRAASDALVREVARAVVIEPDRRAAPHWPRLPETHPEAVRAARTFGEVSVIDGPTVRLPEEAVAVVCVGHAANRHLVLSREAARAQNLLFDVHGYANPDNPWLSALMLTDATAGSARQPSPLTMTDVMGLRLSARTVVLAACRTGAGRLRAGEGVVGFPLAFMGAGADTVVMTQWEVPSTVPLGGGVVAYPTTDVVVGFYEGWRVQGLGRAEALCRAQRAVRDKGGVFADPFYWAAWQAYGEWRSPKGVVR